VKRNPDVILTVRSRDTWRDPIPSQNRESGVGRAKESALQKLRYAKSRNPETITTVHFRGQVAADHRIVISAFRSLGFSKTIATGPRNSRNRDTRYSDTISVVRLSGHVANIVAPVGKSTFGVSSCQRNLTSQLAKSRYAKS
jgi:hypothetical protein